jgi:NifU-like protein involved in Fe-S cluster formation
MISASSTMIALVVDKRFSEVSKMMNEQEKDLEKAEQEFFETIISMILYLNKNGIRLDAVREMIQMKVEDAFAQYPKLAEDCQWKNRTWQDDEDL